ncbi:MAG TPA: GNAT family N-acetyltransferase [Thermoleophilaceae bacterium]|nr:GNAT family N-acetyltransferase [Thermoleophilaceae bacterium]
MAEVDDAEGWRRLIASLAQWSRTIDGASEGMRVIEREGFAMTITPRVPDRSIVNDVVYWDRGALDDAYVEIEQAYAAAGIAAWTVWVPDTDDETADLLAERGHVLDADPEAMVLDLDAIERPSAPAGFTRAVDPVELARLNDDAYGMRDAFARALARLEVREGLHLYGVEEDGELASGLVTFDHGDDCSVWLVATRERSRGRGLAGALMAHALADARERGRTTSTLQATDLGRPVYERLGYRSLGEIQMWEKRTGA